MKVWLHWELVFVNCAAFILETMCFFGTPEALSHAHETQLDQGVNNPEFSTWIGGGAILLEPFTSSEAAKAHLAA